jgi:hypothetical protein
MNKIRAVKFNDYNQIKKLQSSNNLNIPEKKIWINLFKKNPLKKKNGWVIENNREIIGYIGNILREYKFNNKIISTACINAFVVKKKYRFLSVLLLRKFFLQKNILLFLNTTSNKETSRIWKKFNAEKIPLKSLNAINLIVLNLKEVIRAYLKKKNLCQNKLLILIICLFFKILNFRKMSLMKNKIFYEDIKFVKKIDNKFDIFFKKYSRNKKKIVSNNRSIWLKWIYQEKIDNNKGWIYAATKNNQIIGYACCIEKNNNYIGLRRVLLTELHAINNNQNVLKKLISNCIQHSKNNNYYVIETVGFDDNKNNLIKSFSSTKRNFGIFPFYYKTNNSKLKKILKNSKSWDIGFSDGDNFI